VANAATCSLIPCPFHRCCPQILVHRFPADAELPGQDRFRGTGRGPLDQLGDLFLVQRRFPAPVGAALFGQGDAFALSVTQQGSFELGERTHHRQQQGGHRGVVPGEDELLLHELHPHPLTGLRPHGAAQIL
jgi:hypothetical protein